MTHPLLTEALQEAFASCNCAEVFETIEITYNSERFGICTGYVDRTITGSNGADLVCKPVPFKFALPSQDSSGNASLDLTMENFKGVTFAFLNAAKRSGVMIVATYRTHFAGEKTSQTPRPVKFILSGVTRTEKGVSMKATVSDMLNKGFPNARYTFSIFPSLR